MINFRITDEERANLDKLVNWINHEDQRKFREEEFKRRWGHCSISDVIRWQLARAHDVIQARILKRKTPGSAKRKTTRSRKRKTRAAAAVLLFVLSSWLVSCDSPPRHWIITYQDGTSEVVKLPDDAFMTDTGCIRTSMPAETSQVFRCGVRSFKKAEPVHSGS